MLITAVALVHLLVLCVHQTLLAPLVILVFMVLLAKINVVLAVPDVLAALPAPHVIRVSGTIYTIMLVLYLVLPALIVLGRVAVPIVQVDNGPQGALLQVVMLAIPAQ